MRLQTLFLLLERRVCGVVLFKKCGVSVFVLLQESVFVLLYQLSHVNWSTCEKCAAWFAFEQRL
jgi:hypothetical protein